MMSSPQRCPSPSREDSSPTSPLSTGHVALLLVLTPRVSRSVPDSPQNCSNKIITSSHRNQVPHPPGPTNPASTASASPLCSQAQRPCGPVWCTLFLSQSLCVCVTSKLPSTSSDLCQVSCAQLSLEPSGRKFSFINEMKRQRIIQSGKIIH